MISEESFVDFKCPGCGDTVSFPQERAGYVESCPSCLENLIVPVGGNGVGRKIPLPISTERLVLRRFGAGDWKDLMELMAHESLFEFEDGAPMEEDAVLKWLESEHHVRLTTPDQLFCVGIQVREPAKLVGYLGLQFRDAQCQQAILTIMVSPEFQRQGAGLEAVRGLLRFCFLDLNMHRVCAYVDSRNVAGLGLLAKAGFRREGELVKDRMFRGGWVNTVVMAALKEDLSAER